MIEPERFMAFVGTGWQAKLVGTKKSVGWVQFFLTCDVRFSEKKWKIEPFWYTHALTVHRFSFFGGQPPNMSPSNHVKIWFQFNPISPFYLHINELCIGCAIPKCHHDCKRVWNSLDTQEHACICATIGKWLRWFKHHSNPPKGCGGGCVAAFHASHASPIQQSPLPP